MGILRGIIGLGLIVLGIVIGLLIPLGSGSAVLIGGVVGLILCFFFLGSRRFLRRASPDTCNAPGEIDEKALDRKVQDALAPHLNDQMYLDQARKWRDPFSL